MTFCHQSVSVYLQFLMAGLIPIWRRRVGYQSSELEEKDQSRMIKNEIRYVQNGVKYSFQGHSKSCKNPPSKAEKIAKEGFVEKP